MSFRRIVFWAHLSVGVAAGLVVMILSVTGVLLTYERQIVATAERAAFTVAGEGREPLSMQELADAAREELGDGASLVIVPGTDGPVRVTAGRGRQVFLDPYTGDAMGERVEPVASAFAALTRLHRWLALEGEARTAGRAVVGMATLAFLFMTVSGLILWWPRIWRANVLKTHLVFRFGLPTGKARDYNWHHVFGIWAVLPLALIALSGVVIAYPWASDLVYRAYGEAPQRGRGGPPAPSALAPGGTAVEDPVPLDAVVAAATGVAEGWRSITVALPAPDALTVTATVDTGNGAQPALRQTVTISRETAEVVSTENAVTSPGRRARAWFRFVHTGEVYGIVGQTIAGLASLAACFLVWTGLALAWRRLILPLFRRRAKPVSGNPRL